MRSVVTARADKSVKGSNEVTVALRFKRLNRHVEHSQMVGHEERVELSALQGLGEPLQMLKVEVGVGIGAGIAPPGRMNADRAHESAKMQLS
jgi:hypothetical protein